MKGKSRASEKLARALRRGTFRTADVFAGCGGMSLGFHRAGFKSVLAVEADEDALDSHILNFARLTEAGDYAAYGDIRQLAPEKAVAHLKSRSRTRAKDAIDVLIGGPPCQAYSLLGRAALWRIAKRKHAHTSDPRATLYGHFLRYVESLHPIAFVMENVPEIGRFNGGNLAEDISRAATALGYTTRYALLNAAWYGVPQYRERLFIVGIRKELCIVPEFPAATHIATLPRGYMTSRAGSSNPLAVFGQTNHLMHFTPGRMSAGGELPSTPTADEALCDLPSVRYHLTGGEVDRLRVNKMISYRKRGSEFGRLMRDWPEFESGSTTDCHAIRFTPRDFRLFKSMKQGAMYPDALRIAERLFRERLRSTERRLGHRLDGRHAAWRTLRAELVPPYDVGRYPNKYRKMSAGEPAHTIPAHLGKDCYSHIHFDDSQARAISVREAARLQSFPDGFLLSGGMNARFTQIGNAVPPLLALAVARRLREQLEG